MGQIMSVALEPIEEVDESEDSLETPPSPIVPARLTEMGAFPYLVDYCKESGNATLAYLLELMEQEQMPSEPAARDEQVRSSPRGEQSLATRQSISGLGARKPF